MRLTAIMPDARDLFEDVPFTLDDLHALQINPAYQCMLSRLRALAYQRAFDGDQSRTAGVTDAIETIGFVEYEAQAPREPDSGEAGGDAILGFNDGGE